MTRVLTMIALFLLALVKSAAAETCRLALVLALDVSGSVNDAEYAQQLEGLAFALNSPVVRSAILDEGPPVHLSVFEWSSRNHQFMIQPWVTLETDAEIDRAVGRILNYRKQRAGLKTALSTAMLYAGDLLDEKTHCWQRTIDVSGDGKNNIGPPIAQTYRQPLFNGITVNALVVGNPSNGGEAGAPAGITREALKRYYEREVIRGTGSFAMIALGYADYARAMQEKLLREISAPVLGFDQSEPARLLQ